MSPKRLMAIACSALVCGLLLAPSLSFAYERRTVAGGKYDVVVGWDIDPAYVNQRNEVGIRISRAGTNPAQPVIGVERSLKVEVRQGADTRSFDVRAVFGQPGYYVADLLPTRDGDYQWTFRGAIDADAVDETFDSADGKFGAVRPSTDVQFPIAAPDPAQVNAELQAERSATQTAQLVGAVGLGVAIVALLAMLLMWLTRPRFRSNSLGS